MTYVTDPIGDLLARMRNAQGARRGTCSAPWSRIKEEIARLLVQEGWLEGVHCTEEEGRKELNVSFVPGKKLTLRRVSKPGRRWYAKACEIKPVLRGYGIAVITTSAGILTDRQAREKGLGGEVLCTVA